MKWRDLDMSVIGDYEIPEDVIPHISSLIPTSEVREAVSDINDMDGESFIVKVPMNVEFCVEIERAYGQTYIEDILDATVSVSNFNVAGNPANKKLIQTLIANAEFSGSWCADIEVIGLKKDLKKRFDKAAKVLGTIDDGLRYQLFNEC